MIKTIFRLASEFNKIVEDSVINDLKQLVEDVYGSTVDEGYIVEFFEKFKARLRAAGLHISNQRDETRTINGKQLKGWSSDISYEDHDYGFSQPSKNLKFFFAMEQVDELNSTAYPILEVAPSKKKRRDRSIKGLKGFTMDPTKWEKDD